MKKIIFRKARPEELEAVLSLLKEAAGWLQKKGNRLLAELDFSTTTFYRLDQAGI
ncbi:MAG: hypothetical protein ABSF37_06205 [Sedimentisphaerales bacterium]|jgi:hypothetical protein